MLNPGSLVSKTIEEHDILSFFRVFSAFLQEKKTIAAKIQTPTVKLYIEISGRYSEKSDLCWRHKKTRHFFARASSPVIL